MGPFRGEPLTPFSQQFWRSPVRWVVLIHSVLAIIGIVLLSRHTNSAVVWGLVTSLIAAQVILLMIGTTLHGKAAGSRWLGLWYLVPLMVLAPNAGAPGWLLQLTGPIMFTFLILLAMASKGLRVKRCYRATMPPPRGLQFSVRGGLLITGGVAVLFALKGIPAMLDGWSPTNVNEFGAAVAIVAMIVVALAICASAPIAAVWAALTPGKMLPRLTAALTGWVFGIILVAYYMGAKLELSVLTLPAVAMAGSILILLVTLLILRAMRYRVVWSDLNAESIVDGTLSHSSPNAADCPVEDDGAPC